MRLMSWSEDSRERMCSSKLFEEGDSLVIFFWLCEKFFVEFVFFGFE